jgi:hypothetical protein
MSQETKVLDYADPSMPKAPIWPLFRALGLLLVVFILQSLFLPCLCERGPVKMNIGLMIDAVVLVRLIIGRLRNETGRGWIAYILLAASTVLWVPALVGD